MMKDTLEILVICHTKYLIFVTIVYIPVMNQVGLPRWLSSKQPVCNAGNVAGDMAGAVGSLSGSGRSLEKEMATHSCILAWGIPYCQRIGASVSASALPMNIQG